MLIAAIAAGSANAQVDRESGSRTVVGLRNPPLQDGADALLDGDAEKGVRLTLIGLAFAQGRRERQAALSNLCAGYLMLEKYGDALGFCNRALEENPRNWRALSNRALTYVNLDRYDDAKADLDLGQEIAPNARSLKEVRGMLRDEVEPVTPNIVIDDRRTVPDDDEE
ncbi:MAG: tetratricopeptide repeat protein [Woeseiaceae bacterium]